MWCFVDNLSLVDQLKKMKKKKKKNFDTEFKKWCFELHVQMPDNLPSVLLFFWIKCVKQL